MCCFLRSCTPTGEAILIINYVCARNYIYKQSITVYNSLICKNSRWIRRFKLVIFNIATQVIAWNKDNVNVVYFKFNAAFDSAFILVCWSRITFHTTLST